MRSGSAHGSSGPNAIDPQHRQAVRPTFPEITLRDIVASQKLLVDSLGLQQPGRGDRPVDGRLPVVPVGGSYPGFMKAIAASVTGAASPTGASIGWRRCASGWRATPTGTAAGTTTTAASPHARGDPLRDLMTYGQNEILAETMPTQGREAAIRAMPRLGEIYDGHSMVVLRRRIGCFDVTATTPSSRAAKVLYVQCQDRQAVRIALCPGYVSDMRTRRRRRHYVELPTDKGHMASHADAAHVGADPGAFHEEPVMDCRDSRRELACCAGTSTTGSTSHRRAAGRPLASPPRAAACPRGSWRRPRRRPGAAGTCRRRSRAPVPLESPQLVEDARHWRALHQPRRARERRCAPSKAAR
jgi:hypothetical protein